MARDLCVVAIRAFGFYPLFMAIFYLGSILSWFVMVRSDLDYPGADFTSTIPTALNLLLGLFCIFFAPWIACRFYGPPDGEAGEADPITLDARGVLRAGIVLVGLYVATELIYAAQQLVEFVVHRIQAWGPIDHDKLVPVVASFACTAAATGILVFGARRIAERLERLWGIADGPTATPSGKDA